LPGVLGIGVALAMMEIIDAYSVSRRDVSLTLATVVGAFGICVGAMLVWRIRQKLSEQNLRLDVALNNMNQGLCMFDPQGRIAIWNERYRQMYNIDPCDIWRGCSVPDLLAARMKAGTFPLDPERYDADLRAALMQGRAFTLNVELKDGRTIAVVNHPMPGGGWVATHEDVSERERAERELKSTRTFLNTIIENVPSPIIVKSMPALQYLLINRAAEKYLGVDRSAMLGKTVADVMPPSSAQMIEAEDRKVIASGQTSFCDEHTMQTPGNGTRIVTATRLTVKEDGRPQYLISVINDLTERKHNEQRIEHLAHHDALTDVPNRAAFNGCIVSTIGLASVSNESFALLCMDLDRFQSVNDVFGHAMGDALLREVARRLEAACQGAPFLRGSAATNLPSSRRPGPSRPRPRRSQNGWLRRLIATLKSTAASCTWDSRSASASIRKMVLTLRPSSRTRMRRCSARNRRCVGPSAFSKYRWTSSCARSGPCSRICAQRSRATSLRCTFSRRRALMATSPASKR
jgi:PAS domain S-box-containing protein